MAGKQIGIASQIKDGMITFNTSTLHAGMYILEVIGEDFTSSAFEELVGTSSFFTFCPLDLCTDFP